jgi:hypothetical protein
LITSTATPIITAKKISNSYVQIVML